MRGRYPLAPLVIPAVIGLVTAVSLICALLSDGLIETASILLLTGVVATIAVKLSRPTSIRRKGE